MALLPTPGHVVATGATALGLGIGLAAGLAIAALYHGTRSGERSL